LLVSDSEDDDDWTVAGIDNNANDRTHEIRLGDKALVQSVKIDGAEQNLTTEKTISTEKTLNINIYNLTTNGTGAFSSAQINEVITSLNQRFAQISTKVVQSGSTISIPKVDEPFPSTIDISDGVSQTEWTLITDHTGTGSILDFEIYFVNQLVGFLGISNYNKRTAMVARSTVNPTPTDEMWLIGEYLAHEIGHLLWNDDSALDPLGDTDGHHSDPSNIMYSSHPGFINIKYSRRLTEAQEPKFQEDIWQ